MVAKINVKIKILGKTYKLAKSLDIEDGYLYDEFFDVCEDLLNDIDDDIDERNDLIDDLKQTDY